MAIPVNIRSDKIENIKNIFKSNYLGNKIGSILIKAPMSNTKSFEMKLQNIKNQFDFAKKIPEAKLSHYLARIASYLPNIMTKWLVNETLKKITFNISNNNFANGNERYVLNNKVTGMLPFAPSPNGVGLTFCISTYNGEVTIGVLWDCNIEEKNFGKELFNVMKGVLKEQGCL